jgi:hypothetical protein
MAIIITAIRIPGVRQAFHASFRMFVRPADIGNLLRCNIEPYRLPGEALRARWEPEVCMERFTGCLRALQRFQNRVVTRPSRP